MKNVSKILEAVKSGNLELIKELVVENPSALGTKTEQGTSLLLFAVYCRNIDVVEYLKRHWSDLDLFEACSLGEIGIVRDFIESDVALIESFAPDGFNPLGLASFFGQTAVVKYLLEKGADVKVASNNDFKVTPLHSACAISNIEIVKMLLGKGSDINVQQANGVTALHSTAYNGKLEISKLLVENGANVRSRMTNGATPKDLAMKNKHMELVLFLETASNTE